MIATTSPEFRDPPAPGVEADIGLPACLQPTVVDVFHDRRPRQDSNLRTRFRKAKRRRKRRSRRVPNRTISAGQRGYYGRERKQPDPDGSRVVGVGWRGGPAPPRSHRSRRESLPSPGSSHPSAGQKARTHFHWANRAGCLSINPVHHRWNRLRFRNRRYFFPVQHLT